MSSDRDDRVDMLDLLINLLKEHEQKMDELTYRLETLLDERGAATEPPRRPQRGISGVVARVSSWREFKRQCTGALSVAVEIDEHKFKVTALSRGIVFSYEEEVPGLEVSRSKEGKDTTLTVSEASPTLKSLMGSLDCGMELDRRVIDSTLPDGGTAQRLVYYVDLGAARSWIADQLSVEEPSVIIGTLSPREGNDE